MDLRKTRRIQMIVLCWAFVHLLLADDSGLSVRERPTVARQLLIQLEPLDTAAQYPPVVTALAGTRDGAWFVAAGDDHALRMVQLDNGRTLRTLEGHTDWVQGVLILDQEHSILSCSNDCTLRRWSAADDWKSTVLHREDFALMSIAVDPSNQFVACAGFGPDIWIYGLQDATLQRKLTCECSDQRALAFSSDGRLLACGGRDGVVRIWEWKTDHQPLEQSIHRDRIRSIGFSDNDTVTCTVGEDRRFVRYQIDPGQVLVEHKIAGGRLLSMTSINDDTIAVAGSDNTIRLIDIRSGNEINRLVGHEGSVAVMIHRGGQLITGSFDTTIRTWDIAQAVQTRNGNYEHPVSARFMDSGAGEAIR